MGPRNATPIILTGDEIAAARGHARMRSRRMLAREAGLSSMLLQRAETAGIEFPAISVGSMIKIVRALEIAGVQFSLTDQGIAMKRDDGDPTPRSTPPLTERLAPWPKI